MFDLINKRKKLKWILMGMIAFLITLNSCYRPFANLVPGDVGFFSYYGLNMVHGGVMYRDFFELKGPIIFFINYLGFLIGDFGGVWLIEIIFMILAYFIMLKITTLYTDDSVNQIVSMILVTCVLAKWFCFGGQVEEFALLPIAYSLYIFIKYVRNAELVCGYEIVLVGAAFAFVAWLRINMVAVWVVASITILIMLVKDKNIKEIMRLLGLFLLGVFIVTLPIAIYLTKHHIWQDMWYQYIVYGFIYSDSEQGNRMTSFGQCILEMSKLGMLIVIFIWVVVWKKKTVKSIEKWMLYLSLVFSIFCANWSGRFYSHYYMIFIPLFVVPATVFVDVLCQKISEYKNKYALTLGLVLILGYLGIGLWGYRMFFMIGHDYYAEAKELGAWIAENVAEDETFYADDGRHLYLFSKRFPTTKYHFYPTRNNSGDYDGMMADLHAELTSNNPDYILKSKDEPDRDAVVQNLIDTKYEMVSVYKENELWKKVE